MPRTKHLLLPVLIVVCFSDAVFAQAIIENWPAPPFWSPPARAVAAQVRESGPGTEAVGAVPTPPLHFVGIAPCRIVDTRGNGAPIQGGIFTGGSDVRSYTIPGICGVPSGIGAAFARRLAAS